MTSLGDFLQELYSEHPSTKERPATRGESRGVEREEAEEEPAFSVPDVTQQRREPTPALKRGADRAGPGELTPSEAATRVLATLAGAGPQPTPRLIAQTGLGVALFLEALQILKAAGFVAQVGSAGEERVELTPNGREAAELPP